MKRTLIAITTLLLIGGCVPLNQGYQRQQTYTTSAESQSTQLAGKMKFGFDNSGQCYKDLAASPIGEPVAKSILIMSDEQPNKYDLLTSKSKLNDSQKKSLKTFLTAATKCRQILADSASGTAYATPIAKRDTESDAIYAKLLTGQMTVGEANTARDQLRIKFREELAAIGKSLDAGFKSSHNAEVAAAERRRAAEIQAAQQQQIINQNQQVINNQIIKSMQPQPPAPVPLPVNTNCTRFGNSINCTSY